MTNHDAHSDDANDEMLALSAKLDEAYALARRLASFHGVDMVALGLDPKVLDQLRVAASDAFTLNRVVVTKF